MCYNEYNNERFLNVSPVVRTSFYALRGDSLYNVGELIFYGRTGVCEIKDITTLESAGGSKGKLYYILKPLYKECKISIPVDNDKIYMRPVISRQYADELIDRIPHINTSAYYSHNLNQLKEHYRQVMESHDCMNMIEMTMSIHQKKVEAEANKKKLGAVDERFMKEAEELIFGEFAAVLDIPRSEVQGYIENRVNTKRSI